MILIKKPIIQNITQEQISEDNFYKILYSIIEGNAILISYLYYNIICSNFQILSLALEKKTNKIYCFETNSDNNEKIKMASFIFKYPDGLYRACSFSNLNSNESYLIKAIEKFNQIKNGDYLYNHFQDIILNYNYIDSLVSTRI